MTTATKTTQTTPTIVRHWFNSFGEYCYELDNGLTIFIPYGDKEGQTVRLVQK